MMKPNNESRVGQCLDGDSKGSGLQHFGMRENVVACELEGGSKEDESEGEGEKEHKEGEEEHQVSRQGGEGLEQASDQRGMATSLHTQEWQQRDHQVQHTQGQRLDTLHGAGQARAETQVERTRERLSCSSARDTSLVTVTLNFPSRQINTSASLHNQSTSFISSLLRMTHRALQRTHVT